MGLYADRGPFSRFVAACQALNCADSAAKCSSHTFRALMLLITQIGWTCSYSCRTLHFDPCRRIFILEFVFLLAVGLLAGAINSLAGGGSFIVFPALLLVGVPPVMANATNTFAALPGYLSGAWGYRHAIWSHRRKMVGYGIAALIGGYLGALLLLNVSDAQFSQVVPWLMLVAVLLFAFGNKMNNWLVTHGGKTKGMALAGAGGLLVLLGLICLYGGFFNAGLGIVLLAFFALAGFTDMHAMNGLKLLISAIVSSIAVARFGLSDAIAWHEGLSAFTGTLIGGYVAARLAHRIPTHFIRWGVIVYGLLLTAIFFWRAYI